MKSSACSLGLYLVVATGLAAAADAPAPPSPGTPASIYAPLAMEAGTWDVSVAFFDPATGAQNGDARGRQVNTLLANGHWIVDHLVVFADDGKKVAFEGQGAWGWDPAGQEYVGSWVDTNDGALRVDHGFWVAEQKTLYWSALQPDGHGHAVSYRMTETFADSTRTLSFFQIAMQSGRQVKLAEMTFSRRD